MAGEVGEERRRANGSLVHVGSSAAIAAFVLAQFVEITFFELGRYPVSLQKLVALVVLPLSLVLMGRIRISWGLLVFAVALLATNSAAFVVSGQLLAPDLVSANTTVLSGFVAAIVLSTALTRSKGAYSFLVVLWIWFSIVTAVVGVFQAFGVLPLWTVSEDWLGFRVAEAGLYRGVGFKFDPNFAALVLVIGVIFVRMHAKRAKLPALLVLLSGIAATFSRMGLLVAILVLVTVPLLQARIEGNPLGRPLVKGLATGLVLIGSVVALQSWGPKPVSGYITTRFGDVTAAYDWLRDGAAGATGPELTSAQGRLLLAWAAWNLGKSSFPLGIGAHRSQERLFDIVRIRQAAHYTYLEFFVTGGLFGLLALAANAWYAWRSLAIPAPPNLQPERAAIIMVCLAFAVVGLLLSLNYNSILWLPLTLALAYKSRVLRSVQAMRQVVKTMSNVPGTRIEPGP